MYLHKEKVYRYLEYQSNSPTDSFFNHLYMILMICKLKKLILEVSSDLKIYLICTAYSCHMKKILHINFCCLFLIKNSKTLYSRHLVIAYTFLGTAGVCYRQVGLYQNITMFWLFLQNLEKCSITQNVLN